MRMLVRLCHCLIILSSSHRCIKIDFSSISTATIQSMEYTGVMSDAAFNGRIPCKETKAGAGVRWEIIYTQRLSLFVPTRPPDNRWVACSLWHFWFPLG